jgi:glycosyltransferase involved in cell wall biosynthesis
MRPPVLHAIYSYGLPSQPFIRDAIQELQTLGWSSWVVTEAVSGDIGAVAPERIALPRRPPPLIDRVATRLGSDAAGDLIRRRAARSYLSALSRLPAGLLHAHFGWTGVDCALAAKKLGLPFLVSFHGTDLSQSPQDPAWAPHYRGMLHTADRATVSSCFLEDRLRAFGYTGPVDVVPAGVRLDAFRFSGGPRPGPAPRLLYVGRLIAVKGLEVLLAALARLRAGDLRPSLEVIGDGPLRDELEGAARAAGLGAAVDFRGVRGHDEVRRALERADMLVVPSRRMPDGQAEGSPVVVKEAQAVGVPIVATDTGGVAETFPPELRHELVPGDDPDALAHRIVQVWDDRAGWPQRVQLQREWVAAEFAWDRLAARLSVIYEALLAERPPARAPLARGLRGSLRPRRGPAALHTPDPREAR